MTFSKFLFSKFLRSKLLFIFALFYLFSAAISAQGMRPNQTDANGQKTGFWEEKDANGKLLWRGKYENDQRQGEWRFYFSPIARHTQEPDIIGFYQDGQRHGEWKIIDTRSRNLLRGKYLYGKMAGEWTYYDKKGRKTASGTFNEEGVRHGLWTIYRNNTPMSKGTYNNGVQDGLWAYDYFHEDSLVHVVGTFQYSNGTPNGQLQHFKVIRHPKFPPQESLMGHGEFQNGQKTGRWIEYTAGFKGERIETGYYDGTGSRTGAWETTINNRPAQECYYNEGRRQGSFKTYYDNGKPKYVTNYERDMESGFFTSYYETGKIKEKGAYTTLEKDEGNDDTLFYKIALPYETILRFIDTEYENFNPNCIKWVSEADYNISGAQLSSRYQEALVYGQGSSLRVEKIIKNDKQSVRVGEYKSFYDNGKVSLEGRFLPYFYVTQVSENSTEKGYARDGVWKEFDELGYNRKTYYYDKGQLRKVIDGNNKDLNIKENRLK